MHPRSSHPLPSICHARPLHPDVPPPAAAAAGLFLIPGALAPELQKRMAVDALTRFPSSPNHTNHTRQLGLLPAEPSLWEAARQGLYLHCPCAPAGLAPSGAPGQGQGQGPAVGAQSAAEPGQATGAAAACGSGEASPPSSNVWSPAPVAGQQQQQQQAAPAAAKLLRKLRWATLGPPYDWTQRVYRRDVHYQRLPQYLTALAVTLAAAVEELSPCSCGPCERHGGCDAAPAAQEGCSEAGGTAMPYRGDQQQQEQQGQGGGGAGGGTAEGCEGAAQCGCSRGSERPFQPDVALVNYYYEGKYPGLGLRACQVPSEPGGESCCLCAACPYFFGLVLRSSSHARLLFCNHAPASVKGGQRLPHAPCTQPVPLQCFFPLLECLLLHLQATHWAATWTMQKQISASPL